MQRHAGFTLVEVMMALLVLTIVLLSLAGSTAGFLRTISASDRQSAAVGLAEDRIARIQMHPDYSTLEATFNATETGLPALPGHTRTTTIVPVGGPGQTQDHKNVTVTVSGPGLSTPIARTVTVAAP